MKKFLIVLSVLILVGISATPTKAYSQYYTIDFTIKDILGFPIPGATIEVVGTSISVTSDFWGEATLRIQPAYWNENLKVRISMIGFKTVEYSYNDLVGKTHIDVKLEDEIPLFLKIYQKFIQLFK